MGAATTLSMTSPEMFAFASSTVVFFSCVLTFTLQSSASVKLAERVHYPDWFISTSIDYPPGQPVGSFLLSLGAVALAYSFAVRYVEVERLLRHRQLPDDGPEKQRNFYSGITAALCTMCAMGVCGVPFHASHTTHTIFAVGFFTSGVAWTNLQYATDEDMGLGKDVPEWVHSLRRGSSWGAVGVMFMGFTVFFVGQAATKFKIDKHKPLVAIEAVLEIVTMLLLLLNQVTYGMSVRGLELRVSLRQVDPPDDAGAGRERVPRGTQAEQRKLLQS